MKPLWQKHVGRKICIFSTFEQECVSGPNDQQPILAKLEYVGWIEEILELNYGVLNTIIFFCNRVKASYTRSNATIKGNEYDFTLVNFNSLIPIFNQFFVFPIHVEQVVFLADPKEKRVEGSSTQRSTWEMNNKGC
jgi:hypothetical protein